MAYIFHEDELPKLVSVVPGPNAEQLVAYMKRPK